MRQSSSKSRFKIQIVNKSALIRLAILFAVLIVVGIWAWLTMFWMPEQSYKGELVPLQAQEVALQKLLQQDVQKLAVKIGIINYSQYQHLNATKSFLETALTQAGYSVKQRDYKIQGKSYYNLEVERLGTNKPQEIIVVGGHYDSVFASASANDISDQ